MAMLAAEFFPRYEGALLIIVNGYSETVWFCFAVTSTTNRPFLENFHAYCGCFLCIFECVIYYQFFFFVVLLFGLEQWIILTLLFTGTFI